MMRRRAGPNTQAVPTPELRWIRRAPSWRAPAGAHGPRPPGEGRVAQRHRGSGRAPAGSRRRDVRPATPSRRGHGLGVPSRQWPGAGPPAGTHVLPEPPQTRRPDVSGAPFRQGKGIIGSPASVGGRSRRCRAFPRLSRDPVVAATSAEADDGHPQGRFEFGLGPPRPSHAGESQAGTGRPARASYGTRRARAGALFRATRGGSPGSPADARTGARTSGAMRRRAPSRHPSTRGCRIGSTDDRIRAPRGAT